MRDADDFGGVRHQFPLGLYGGSGQQRAEVTREIRCRRPAFHNFDKALQEGLLILRRKRGFVFDGVSDAAQEIGVAYRFGERIGQLGNGQGEGS